MHGGMHAFPVCTHTCVCLHVHEHVLGAHVFVLCPVCLCTCVAGRVILKLQGEAQRSLQRKDHPPEPSRTLEGSLLAESGQPQAT